MTYWRRRLAGSADPNRIFTAVKELVAASGALKGRTARALDSTILDDAVATQDTVTQLVAAIRKVARLVPAAGPIVAGRAAAGQLAHDYTDPGKPKIAWDDAQARAVLIDALVRDALAVLAGLGFALLSRRRAPAPADPLTEAERRRLDALTGP